MPTAVTARTASNDPSDVLALVPHGEFPPDPPSPASPPTVAVRAVYCGITTHARILTFPTAARQRAGRQFTIGWQSGVDAPVGDDFVPWAAHPLVLAAGADYVVNVTPQMTGQVSDGGIVYSLAAYTERRGQTFPLPPSGEATLDCGASRFVISRTAPPRTLPPPRWRWSWARHGYALASGVALALFLLVIAYVPADPRSLAFDIYGRDGRMLPTLIKPPVPEEQEVPSWLKKPGQDAGGKGSTAAGAEGAMGDTKAPKTDGLFAEHPRATETELRLSRQQAADQARSAGILGVFQRVDSSPLASILSTEKAMGDDAEDVIGALHGSLVASNYGPGGLGVHGTGAQAGGTGEGLRGHGGLDTIGQGGDSRGPGPGWGREVGRLTPRRVAQVVPDLNGIASVRGALDKSIVRRVVRQHINEVKYCYERELARKPALGGRVVVNFAIAGTGQVLTSVLQSSTMANAAVENCTVQAVKRWQFPAPEGGGLVTVTYPFVLTPAGG